MSSTPLNPDALEEAADLIWMRANGEHGVCRADRERGSYRIAVDAAEEAITAYLAAAQPEMNSVEVIRRLRRAMNGKYSSFDETYTIPRRDLEYLVLDLQGNNPFTEVKP